MSNTAAESLASHPLMKLAVENLTPLLQEAGNSLSKIAEQGEVRNRGNATLFEHEFYDNDVFHKAHALVQAMGRLEQCQQLIDAASKSGWDGAGLDRHTWIEYHYSYYVLTFVSLADIAPLLTNSVFRLGIRERDCRADLITRNWWVAQTPVKASLEQLAEAIRPYKEGRNLHVHQGRLQSIAEVMGSKLLDQLQLFSFVERVGKPAVPSDLLKIAYEIEIPKISGRLTQEREGIIGRIIAVLDALYPVYKQKSENLHELHENWRRAAKAELDRRASIKPARQEDKH